MEKAEMEAGEKRSSWARCRAWPLMRRANRVGLGKPPEAAPVDMALLLYSLFCCSPVSLPFSFSFCEADFILSSLPYSG